jgi:hypothetical protein
MIETLGAVVDVAQTAAIIALIIHASQLRTALAAMLDWCTVLEAQVRGEQ